MLPQEKRIEWQRHSGRRVVTPRNCRTTGPRPFFALVAGSESGSVRAPGLANFDFSLMKNFRLGENRRLQFRSEFFNVMNTPFFGGDGYVNVNVSSPTFGQITQAGDPRVIQLGLKGYLLNKR